MAFRGYFALNGTEIANSSRVVAHIGATTPTSDLGLLGGSEDCSVVPSAEGALLGEVPTSSSPTDAGSLLYTPPDGSRLYGPGLALVGDCWTPDNLCFGCRSIIEYDDSWPGLSEFLSDSIYRPELAPWYTTRAPESAEFGGVWVMDVKGLDTTPIQRDVSELAGAGGAAGPHRDAARKVTFEAVLIACSNAGLTYGLQWLTCQLRDTAKRTDSVLRYLAAHPSDSAVDPAGLVREVHGVVLTQEPQITAAQTGRGEHSQATTYRVSWELTVTRPYAYTPAIDVPVEWDTIAVEPIRWIHAADCRKPASCEPMPVLFGEGCELDKIEVVTSPPPSCGGCLPVCAVETRIFEIPTFDYPLRCSETAVSLTVRNTGARALTLQGYLRRCNAREDCDDHRWPVQINGLPPQAELILDGIGGRYWAEVGGVKRRPVGIVGTPTGAPWRPPVIDRSLCWELVVISDGDSAFEVGMSLADREA